MKEPKSNFSFMKNIDIYEKSDAYRRICENARLAEGSYFINSDIFHFYVRKAVELSCKFIEISDELNIYTSRNSTKKTIGTYLLEENCFEFIPAIGGISNYNLVRRINEGVNPSAHDNFTTEKNKIESHEIIVAFYELMVWLYRKYGGVQKILKSDFDEKLIPYETDISFFFKEKDLNMDISERDQRYIESIRKRDEEKIQIVREGDKLLVTEQDTGRTQYYLLEDFHNKEISNEQKIVERLKTEIINLNDDLEKVKKEHDEKEKLWLDEKSKILDEVAELERNFQHICEEDKNTIVRLKEQLCDEEEKHSQLAKEYEEHFTHFQTEISFLNHQCEIYKEQSGQLEEIMIAYEQLKAEHSAIKYQIETQKQHIIIPTSVNQLIVKRQLQGTEKLREYLLRLKAYYDEKERVYNQEIERISQERDEFKRKFEEKLNDDSHTIGKKPQYVKRKMVLHWGVFALPCLLVFILIVYAMGISGNFLRKDPIENANDFSVSNMTVGITEPTENGNGTYKNSDKMLEDLTKQQIIIPQNLESVVGINQQLLTEKEGLDIKSISVFGKKTKRENMCYIGESIVPGMTKNGSHMYFMGMDSKRNLCNMTDNEIIKFSYMSGNGMGCVMIAVEISDLSDKLSRESTLEDVMEVLGDDVTYHEMDTPTNFCTSQTETAVLFEFEKKDGAIVLFGEDGYVCDYVYVGIQ